MARKSKKFKLSKIQALILGAAGLLIVAGGLSYWHYHNQSGQALIPSSPSTSTTTVKNSSASQSGTNPATSDKQVAAPGSSDMSSSAQNPTDNTGQPPSMPTGNFVSNHKPGGNYPTTEQSACNTTPGASCYIKFTSGSNTETLKPQITDSNGTTIWNWDAATFPSGTWQVTATAALNGQTKTVADATPLTIP